MKIEKLILNIKSNKQPLIIFSSKAYNNMMTYLKTNKAVKYEFMFVGLVDEHKYDEGNVYIIKDTVLIPQCKNSGVYCETDDEGYTKWLTEQPIKIRKSIRLHGHSHVNMSTNPSSLDNQQLLNMMNYVNDYFIQLIYNHKNEFTINLYDKRDMLIYKNLDFRVQLESGIVFIPETKSFIIPDSINLKPEYDEEHKLILLLGDNYYTDIHTQKYTGVDKYLIADTRTGLKIRNNKETLKEANELLNKYIKEEKGGFNYGFSEINKLF